MSSEAIDEVAVKDDTEIELEKAVFGDDDAFYDGLLSYNNTALTWKPRNFGQQDEDVDSVNGTGLQDIDDADLFFLDTEPSRRRPDASPGLLTRDDEGGSASEDSAAWVDSDDERLTVSLASNNRLRKLRINESEDIINGVEYSKRLRLQYERLHPPPAWAVKATAQKRRKLNGGGKSSSDSESASDVMSEDDEELTAQPLATLLRNTDSLTSSSVDMGRNRKLRPEIIDMHRLKDIGTIQKSAISTLSFHPSHPLLLTSTLASCTLSLHHLSPHHPTSPNPCLTSLHARSTPITSTSFLPPSASVSASSTSTAGGPPPGNKILFAGRRRYFHVWDLGSGQIVKITRILGHAATQRSMEALKASPCGRYMGLIGTARKGGGFINVLDAHTYQWIAEIRVEGTGGVADFAWWGNGEGMVVLGKGGEAVEWDGQAKRVVRRWTDEGAVGTTVIALGGGSSSSSGPAGTRGKNEQAELGGDRWLAVGSSAGIVNLYDRKKWVSTGTGAHHPGRRQQQQQQQQEGEANSNSNSNSNSNQRPRLVRSFDQLVTPISHLAFSPDGQVLCLASRWKRDALRLVHLPSATVYRNWPTAQTPLGRISALGWSPTAKMLAVGNEQGNVRLWEVRG